MHELGILRQISRTVDHISQEYNLKRVLYITLQVGKSSGFVPMYLNKLFNIAKEAYPILKETQLRIEEVLGDRLIIKEIGY